MKEYSSLSHLSRRDFAELSIAAALGYSMLHAEQGFAAACQPLAIKDYDAALTMANGTVPVWINGFWAQQRCQLAAHFLIKQSAERYVEQAVLASSIKRSMATRYFGPEDRTDSGYCPYIVFNDVDLRFSDRIFLLASVRENKKLTVYRHTIERSRLGRSRFDAAMLPQRMARDFGEAAHNGAVFSPLYFPKQMAKMDTCDWFSTNNCLESYFPKPRLDYIDRYGNFRLQVFFEQPDQSYERFMRYFFVTDPAGRILALYKRHYGEKIIDSKVSLENKNAGWWREMWDVEAPLIGIQDCPYVMVYMENAMDGIFGVQLWLH